MEAPPHSPLTSYISPPPPLNHRLQAAPRPAIHYSPDEYGTWEAFTDHPDFMVAAAQYIQTFAQIDRFIAQHCHHPIAIQASFADFLVALQDETFASRESLLYGEGKRMFETFCALLQQEAIPLEKKVEAVSNLAEEIGACADGAMNSLIMIVHHLQCVMAGPRGEALRIRNQIIEQLVQEFSFNLVDDENMEKHHVAVYLNFLRQHYVLPSLENDVHANAASLGITQEDLSACLQYVKNRLTLYSIIPFMAEAYLSELHGVISADGIGLTDQEAISHLSALKTRLTPIYGDIPDTCLLREINGRYYATPRDTLIQLFLMQNLQICRLPRYQVHTLYQHQVPSTLVPIRKFNKHLNQFVTEPQTIRGENVYIRHTGPLYFVQIEGETTPTLLTLSHLKPFVHNITLPIDLMQEAINNTSAEEIEKWVSVWIANPAFFNTYLRFKFKAQEKVLEEIIIELFNQGSSIEEMGHTALQTALQKLGLERQSTVGNLRDMPLAKLFWLLSKTLEKCIENSLVAIIDNETCLLNLLSTGMSATICDSVGNTLLMQAAIQGWLGAIDELRWLGAKVDEVNASNQSALMFAAAQGQLEIVKTLCTRGANLALTSQLKRSAFTYAVIYKHLPVIEFLLTFRQEAASRRADLSGIVPNPYFDINARDSEGRTALLSLFEGNDEDDNDNDIAEPTPEIWQRILGLLLEHGADVHARTPDGLSVLGYINALTTGCFDRLLAAGASPSGKDTTTILCNVIRHNQLATLKKLLALNIPLVHTPADWESDDCPISEALEYKRWEIAALLLPYAQPNLTHLARAKLLYLISKPMLQGELSAEEGKFLLSHVLDPAFISQPDARQRPFFGEFLRYLETSAYNVKPDHLLVQLNILMAYDIDIHLPVADGDTLLMYLVKNAFSSSATLAPMIRYLATHTGLLTLQDSEGFTPFARAAQTSDIPAMEILLAAHPAILNILDAHGDTPFRVAANNQQGIAMNWLLVKGADVTLVKEADHIARIAE
jgi:ankyrin repeat protein